MSGRTKDQIQDRTREILEAIREYHAETGKMPTRRELKVRCNISSEQTVGNYMMRLER